MVTTTPKSSKVISKKTNLDSARVDVTKNRNYPSQQKQKNGTIMNSKAPSTELISRRKDLSSSESGSNTSSPLNSPRATRKATVGPMVAGIIDKFSSTSQTSGEGNVVKEETSGTIGSEKKIARVLPMTPQFIEEHLVTNTESDPSSTKPYDDSSLIINKLQSTLGLLKGNDGGKGFEDKMDSGVPPALKPSMSTAPQQVSSADGDGEGSSVRVGVRVRPFLPSLYLVYSLMSYFLQSDTFLFIIHREEKDPNVKLCISMKDHETIITSDAGMEYQFNYDYSIWSFDPKDPNYVDQEKLYKLMGQPLLNSAFEGYNTCLFAYGQTGSGKSYSVMGQGDEIGILPRFCEELFERIKCWKELQFTVEISYFEIYNERIHDLLASSKKKDGKRAQLRVREHPILGPFVQDLTTYTASSYADVESWLAVGNSIRATAATGMNDKSSRSHSVFTIIMTQTRTEIFEDSETQMTTASKINLIDLAGSERASQVLNDQVIKTSETAALRLKEGGSINKSLHTLGKVISLLSDREAQSKKKMYIPYRDSTLTWLLKDSLGGNSKTAMIANISPASTSFGESLKLKAEIERLKQSHVEGNQQISARALAEVASLREKLKETQHLLAESTRNWQEKLALTEKRKLEEAEKLKKAGISFKVDNRLPNLVNLNEDPQLSEMLLYMLKEGDAPTYVNGQLIVEETVLHHADRVVIGGDHFFRLNHPKEVKKRKMSKSEAPEGSSPEAAVLKDFEFARNELAQAQNARLQAELEEAKEEARIQAQEEIVARIQEAKEAAQQEMTEQKQIYEEKVSNLHEAMESLTTEKEQAEQSKQTAVEKISELEAHRLLLEQEILNNRKKLQMEALAAKQALEETKMNQVRIITELEKEKKKMQDDVLKLKEAKQNREKIREEFRASFNSIGRKNSLAGQYSETFSRDDVVVDGKSEMKIRLNNTKKGLTTLWSLEKFQSALEQMRELYQQRDNDSISGESGDEVDPFNDPDDKWEKDFKLDSGTNRRSTSTSSSGLSGRTRSSSTGKAQGFSPNKAESIFAKYRNKQTPGLPTEAPEAPSDVPGTSSERPVVTDTPSRPPMAPIDRRRSETRRPGPSLPRLCRDSLKNYVDSLKGPFSEPMYEKILRVVKEIKKSVTTIVKAFQDKETSVGGLQTEGQQCCVSASISVQMLVEHVRMWGTTEITNEPFVELSSQLLDTIKRLAGHVISIIEILDGSSTNTDDLVAAFTDDVRHTVRQTAKMAVLSSQEEKPKDGNTSVCEDDSELNKAFVEGQDMSMEISVRDSISAINEIQEQIQTDNLDSGSTGVEREITEHVLALVRTTGDFIHQGREVQMQLATISNDPSCKKDTGLNRLVSVKKFVSSVNTLLQRTRDLASNVRRACDDMDLEKLVSIPEEICSSVGNIVRQKRAFIETEYSVSVGSNQDILDEMEYLEKKCEDVELAAGNLRKTVTKFLFLSPAPKSLQKKRIYKVFGTEDDRSEDTFYSPFIGGSNHTRTPLVSRSKNDSISGKESRSTRKLWSKESPL
ncbi:hypothetical protein pdam_00019081 [Pocillopora damicornis]|uniref:Kinesin motor domain-containing protein n=1 Tax=Pocillopora damicornis TaxID=46731 RepID=A0A3M6U1R9_POCDA|nr:hypothetical protein pdam_00019081 [Pocillopora damicornis]